MSVVRVSVVLGQVIGADVERLYERVLLADEYEPAVERDIQPLVAVGGDGMCAFDAVEELLRSRRQRVVARLSIR